MPCPFTTRRVRRVRHLPVVAGAGLAAALGCLPTPASADDITDLQREVKEMQRHYDTELKRLQTDYESRIHRLETRLKAAETKTATRQTSPAKAETTASSPPAATETGPAPAPVASAAAPQPLSPEPAAAAAPTAGGGGFNPAIGVILQGKAAAFSQNPDTYRVSGFALGDETSPGTARPVARRERDQFPGQCRPLSVRQPDLSLRRRQPAVDRGGLYPIDQPARRASRCAPAGSSRASAI